jgi:hypothetical protein
MTVALPVGWTEIDFISHLFEDTYRPVLKNNVVFIQTFGIMEKIQTSSFFLSLI